MIEPSLPSERQIDKSKIVDYLLHPTNSRGKADWFVKLGFSQGRWMLLRDALLEHANTMPVTSAVASAYGTRYIVTGSLKTPSGRVPPPITVAVWQHDFGMVGVRLITAYPG
jgi:hypothetical protein